MCYELHRSPNPRKLRKVVQARNNQACSQGAGNSKRLAGTIQTACSDRDTCVLMGSLTGALLHYGGVHREENLDRYVPLHNRDMKKEI